MKEAIKWSATKVLSRPLEEMVYEYNVLGEIDERGIRKDEVFFTAVEKEYVNKVITAFAGKGYSEIVLLTDTAFIYPFVVEEIPGGSVAVIDIGGKLTGIYIIYNRTLRFLREIMTASESFTDALMSGMGLNYEEAERYKVDKGFDEASMNALSLPLERFAGEVQRTFSVYAQRCPERPVGKIYITGRGSQIPNLLKRLQESFAEEIEHLGPLPGVADEFLPSYNLCIHREGLVNLLPEEIKTRGKETILKMWVKIGTAGILVLLLILSFFIWNGMNRLNVDIEMEKENLTKKKAQLTQISGTMSAQKYFEIIPVIQEVQKRDTTFILLMKYLSSVLPKEIYLTSVEFDRERISDSTLRAGAKEPPSKEPGMPKVTAKETSKETTAENPSKDAAMKVPAQGGGFFVALRGYIFADVSESEPVLLNAIIKLEKSGLLQQVKVVSRDTKEINGEKAMVFTLSMWCPNYEI